MSELRTSAKLTFHLKRTDSCTDAECSSLARFLVERLEQGGLLCDRFHAVKLEVELLGFVSLPL